jgi:hypothetical protein
MTDAQDFWRAEVKRAKLEGRLAPDAQEIASRRLRERYPQYRGKSTKTIVDQMGRRQKPQGVAGYKERTGRAEAELA